jgi:hypothetical protein
VDVEIFQQGALGREQEHMGVFLVKQTQLMVVASVQSSRLYALDQSMI